MPLRIEPDPLLAQVAALTARVTALEKHLGGASKLFEYGFDKVIWTVKGIESAKKLVKFKAIIEPETIQLTPLGTGVKFDVFEGGPYAGKFNAVGITPYKEEFVIGTEAFFWWFAVGV